MGTQDSTVVAAGGVSTVTDSPEGERNVSAAATTGVVSTRAGRAWVKVLPALLVLAVILVFIFQNSQSAKVSFVTASGRVPLAIALLAAAALGALFVLAIGSIRILQLRKMIHRSSLPTQAHQTETGAP